MYERYRFNKRTQETGDRFDVFLGEISSLARACAFGDVEKSMIRGRTAVVIKDDKTRHKLLQIRDLTLDKAIDVCNASEANDTDPCDGRCRCRSDSTVAQVETCSQTSSSWKSRCRTTGDELRKDLCPTYDKCCRRCKSVKAGNTSSLFSSPRN